MLHRGLSVGSHGDHKNIKTLKISFIRCFNQSFDRHLKQCFFVKKSTVLQVSKKKIRVLLEKQNFVAILYLRTGTVHLLILTCLNQSIGKYELFPILQ